MGYNKIIQGDSLEVLKTLPAESVDCCITSPPYFGLRDYGTADWEGGDKDCEHTISSGDLDPKKAGQQERVTRGERDKCVVCGAKRVDSQLGLESSPEEYVANQVAVYREVKRVLKKEGTLWLNIGDSYAGSGGTGNQFGQVESGLDKVRPPKPSNGLKPKDLIGIPWRVAFALQADGWYLRQDIIWAKPNPMPESVTDRCTKSHEYVFLLSKSPKYYFDNEAIQENAIHKEDPRAGYGRIHYRGKREGAEGTGNENFVSIKEKRNKRDVWTVNTKPFAEAHFATFPEALIEPMVLAGCPKGGVVLDPFMGAGTTAVVALKNNRKYLGCELNPKYIEIAEHRLKSVTCSMF